MKRWQFAAGAVSIAGGVLSSMSAMGQGPMASDQSAFVTGAYFEPTLVRIPPTPDKTYGAPRDIPAVPYSCLRVGRCSAYDVYYFRDRPNRLTRLAPEPPAESSDLPPWIQYEWIFVPVTPEANIVPKYRTASQVRDEYRTVGTPIDDDN